MFKVGNGFLFGLLLRLCRGHFATYCVIGAVGKGPSHLQRRPPPLWVEIIFYLSYSYLVGLLAQIKV